MDCGPPGSSVHGISQQEYCSGLPFPSPEVLPDPGIEPMYPALADGFFTTGPSPLTSDSDRKVPADLGQESQAASWVEAWNSACLSRCPRGQRPLVELYLEPGGFSGRCTGESLPLRVDFIHRVEFGEVSGHWVLIKRGPGNRGPTECGSTHEATSGMSS